MIDNLVGVGTFAIQLYTLLEIAQIKRAIVNSESVDYKKPAVIELVHSWKA